LYLVRTGRQWRLLPPEHPNWRLVYYHFARWRDDHAWEDIVGALREQARRATGRGGTKVGLLCLE
jgi:transposase